MCQLRAHGREECICVGVEGKIVVDVCLYNFEYKCACGGGMGIKMGCGLCVNIPRRLPVFT